MGLFLTRAGLLIAGGLGTGLLGAWAASTLTRSMVFGISPVSPVHLAVAAGVMILVVFSATLIPVRKATRVDPLVALRSE